MGESDLPQDALWVNNLTGNDSYTKAQILAGQGTLAWATLNRAMWGNTNRAGSSTPAQAVDAGETVYVVYTGSPYTFTSSLGGNLVQFQPANSGSAGNPIIIEAYGITFGSQWVELRATGGGGGHVFGAIDESVGTPGGITKGYIQYRGFLVDENATASGSWTCHFLGYRDIEVEYCKFIGDGLSTSRGDNHNATRFTHCYNYWVHNCYVTGYYSGGGSEENGNAFECYWSGGGIFEHNYVTDCGMGWFLKAPNHEQSGATNSWGALAPHVVRFNHFHDCEQGISPHRLNDVNEAYGSYIYQNLLTQMRGTCVRFKTFSSDTYSPHHTKFFNNTIWSDEASQPEFEIFTDDNDPIHADSAIICQNNIIKLAINIEGFHGAGAVTYYSDLTGYLSDRNCWDIAAATSGNFFVGTGNASYATWRTQGQDANSGSGRTTVTFESAGTDFRLTANGQTALTMGRALYNIGGTTGATISCGCYITGSEIIGIEAP